MYDDTVASPVNGKYSGQPDDGVSGSIDITVRGGVITGGFNSSPDYPVYNQNIFEFDAIRNTAGDNFAVYGDPSEFLGSIDASGNISLTTTGLLGTFSRYPSLVDEAWNIDNYNGLCDTQPCAPNTNTTYDTFTTGAASNSIGTINGARFDGASAILVKGGSIGNSWGDFFGAPYFEVWSVQFDYADPSLVVPIPASVWLFGSGLLSLVGFTRRKKAT